MAEMKQVGQLDLEIEAHSKELLNSLITEFQTAKWFPTHVGTIVAVRNDADNNRYYVLQYADGYVYMPQSEMSAAVNAVDDVDSLIGTAVPFKTLSVDGEVIIVSNLFCTDMYRLAQQNNSTMSGTIVSSYYDKEDSTQSYFQVRAYGDILTMMLPDFSIYSLPKFLPALHNVKVDFKVLKVADDGTVYISRAACEDEHRREILAEIKELPDGFLGNVVKVTDSAAYLVYRGVLMILRNRDFSTDYTPVNMVKKKGDKILVKFQHESRRGRIFVEPVEKYTAPENPKIEQAFQRGQRVTGVVTGVSSFGLFVRIAPGLDMLCRIPEQEPEKGDTVSAVVIAVDPASSTHRMRIRGKVLQLLHKKAQNEQEEEN